MKIWSRAGHAGFAEGLRLLVDEAMRHERAAALLGHANGFKPKTLSTRLGPIQFQIP